TENHAAVPGIVRDQRERVRALVVGATVLDQLEGGHDLGHGSPDFGGCIRCTFWREAGAKSHGQLELDHEIDEVLPSHLCRRLMNAPLVDHAAAWVIDAHQ